MKKLFSFLFVWLVGFSVYAAEPDSLLLASNSSSEPIDKEHCTCKGIPLYGRVRVVEYSADFDVKIIEHSADLDVRIVDFSASNCGEWQFVEHSPDFTVRFVEHSPDFEIRIVEHAPGIH